MSSNAFDHLCNHIYQKLYDSLQRKDDHDNRFATNGTAKRVLHPELLVRLFRCLSVAKYSIVQRFGLTETELAQRVDDRELHDFLAVLVFASCGIEAATIFTAKLVASNEWPFIGCATNTSVQSLPANRQDLLGLFDDNAIIVDKFCKTQACFSTVVILKRQEVSVESLTSQRLPYLEEEECGTGTFGKVYKVKIAPGHFKDPIKGVVSHTTIDLARKDYIARGKFGEEEQNIMKTILNGSTRKCENILSSYGSLRVGLTTYSLFMPCAICDLRAYMLEYHPVKPSTVLEKAEIILSAKGLADGLDFLHNEMKTPDQEHMVCYHMDLKPSNILVFLKTAYDGGSRYVWKLSDFGMARVKTRKRGQTVERNFDSSFLHRKQPDSEPSPSGTLNRRGEGTYLAPEALKRMPTMTTSSDVWSLGCVLSAVFAYIEDGSEGINDYQTRRLEHPDSDGYDRFFLRGNHFRSSKEHPEVHNWHTHLIEKAAHRQAEEGYAIEYVLKYLEKKVLVIDYKKRDGVKAIKERLTVTYTLLKQMPSVERSDELPTVHRRWLSRLLHKNHKITPQSDEQITSWQLSAVNGLKGCQISPQGNVVAYWSDFIITLYNELSLPSKIAFGEPQLIHPAAEYELKLPGCIWNSVVLSERYLIASTSAANFECYIYDISRAEDHHIHIHSQLPEISKLAISPDSKMLACIIQGKEEGQDQASVLIVSVMDLIQHGSLRQSDYTMLKLDWSATDITHISFSSPDEVYLVVQPQITAKSRENEITVLHLSLKPRQIQTVLIQSQGVDPGNVVGLFTAFTAFRQQPSICAFITRQKHLHIQALNSPRSNDVQHPIKNYRILQLVMDWDDRKMFALGTHLGKSRVHLLEMTVPRSETDKVAVSELAILPGLSQDDEFTLVLSHSPYANGSEKYILIAALATTSPRWIYRIPLFDSSTES